MLSPSTPVPVSRAGSVVEVDVDTGAVVEVVEVELPDVHAAVSIATHAISVARLILRNLHVQHRVVPWPTIPEVFVSTLAVTRILPRSRTMTAALVVTFTAITALLAQVRIPLWFTPVPVTGQTFAVVASGLVLGWRLGAASQALYLGVGAVGVPVFQGAQGGWSYLSGPTLGYLVGFVAAAALVGAAHARFHFKGAGILAATVGTIAIYVFGVAWLMHALQVDLPSALRLGVFPFLAGDAIKAVFAGLLPVR
jgi:biotin transport system substrate-specific component